MIFGLRMQRVSWRGLLALAMLATAAPPLLAFDLGELMAQLSQRQNSEARFSEQRFVSGLQQTLSYSGTLSFKAPDRLARHTLSPRAESFVVEGNRVTLERGGRVRQLTLDAAPELAAMVAAMRGTLSGDAATLRQHFQASVSGSAAQWTLTLVPLDSRLATMVRRLRLVGEQAELRTLEVQLTDGDRSVMSIEPLTDGPSRSQKP